jgi:hypothetical protein
MAGQRKHAPNLILFMLLLLALNGLLLPAHAADMNVGCDVQQLIDAINTASTGVTINLASGCTYTLTNGYSGGKTGLPYISKALTIHGNGAIIERNTAAGTSDFRLFYVSSSGNLVLNNLTLKNGVSDFGAAIYNSGKTTANSVTFSNNFATSCGGGISNNGGESTVNNSTFSGNSATGSGGGIFNSSGSVIINASNLSSNSAGSGGGVQNNALMTINNSTISENLGAGIYNFVGATLTIRDSTISGNQATYGGGIGNNGSMTVSSSTISGNKSTYFYGGGIGNGNGGILTVSNSTISGNSGPYYGGGISNWGTVTISSSTLSDNAAVWGGGGIYNYSGDLELGNSIVAGNSATDAPDLGGTITSLGYNLVGSTSGAILTGTLTGNLIDAAASPLNLGALANNGGPTLTMALGTGSVAINAGNENLAVDVNGNPLTTDQRGSGFPRVAGSTVDIGAFEAAVVKTIVVVQLEGNLTAPDARWVQPLHLVVTSVPAATLIFDQQVTTDEYGHFEFELAAPGAYRLWVKGSHTLAAAQNITVVAGANTVSMGALKEGDTDGNNVVNLTDFSLLAAAFGKQTGQTGFDARADFNGDSVVNLTDFSLLATSFGQSGAS